MRCVLERLGHSLACKNLGAQHPFGAEIWSSEKVDFGGYYLTFRCLWLWDQGSPDFFRWTWKESRSIRYLSDFEYLHLFRRYSPSNFEVVLNRAKFCMFLLPKIYLERAPEILDRDYKIEHTSHYGAEFCGDRPTELGDRATKKKKK